MEGLTSMLTKAHEASVTLTEIVDKGVTMTPALLDILGSFFADVEIVYPIPVLEIDDETRASFARDILTEMADAFEAAAVRCAAVGEDAFLDDGFAALADATNGLWKEFVRLYAAVANAEFAERDPEAERRMFDNVLGAISDASGMTPEEAKAMIVNDPVARARLRRSGIDPDAL